MRSRADPLPRPGAGPRSREPPQPIEREGDRRHLAVRLVPDGDVEVRDLVEERGALRPPDDEEEVGAEGRFFSDIAEELGMSPTRLKGLVKRSDRLEYRGHRIERIEPDPPE